jgi:ADP-ribose pyrophosphatase YjhB (NUDIX family)
VRVQNANVLAELLNAISVVGLLDQLGGSGILFNNVTGNFILTPQGVDLREGAATGGSLGVSMQGIYQFEGKALVGRQSRFPPGNYSALAGFLEPGECIEEAVRREIHEEAGVTCGAVRYVTSQPWPFGGSQLMIACTADALGDALTLDTDEIEDAMWVTKEEAKAALEGASNRRFNAPPPFAIAHSLLRHWVSQ